MDFETAHRVILRQTIAPEKDRDDSFMACLRQGRPPVPGQVTSLLLALKVVYEGLKDETNLDRETVRALFSLSYESSQCFEAGRRAGVLWPPLLEDDLKRIAASVRAIVANTWDE